MPDKKKDTHEGISKYRAAQQAAADIKKMGLPLPRQPEETEKTMAEKFKDDAVTKLSDEDVMKMMGLFTGFQGYAEYQLAISDVDLSCASSTLDFIEAEMLLHSPKFGSVKEKESWVMGKPEMAAGEKDRLYADAKVKMLKALAHSYEKKSGVLSRELSRRTANLSKQPFQS